VCCAAITRVGEFYSVALTKRDHQQADTGTKMIHIGKNTRSTIISKGISAGHGSNAYRGLVKVLPTAANARNYSQCDSLLMSDQCGAHTFPYIEMKNPTATVEHEASTSKIGDDQIFYLPAARHQHRGRRQPDRQRFLQGGVQGAADGIRRGSAETDRGQLEGAIEVKDYRPKAKGSRIMLEIRNLHVTVERSGDSRRASISMSSG
jgi:hypothetical protein